MPELLAPVPPQSTIRPSSIANSGVMRLEISAETSHSVAGGTSPVRDQEIVGSDSSSATQGSSTASVAGKKRAPTKQWANASVKGSAANTSASATAREYLWIPDMEALHWRQRNTAA